MPSGPLCPRHAMCSFLGRPSGGMWTAWATASSRGWWNSPPMVHFMGMCLFRISALRNGSRALTTRWLGLDHHHFFKLGPAELRDMGLLGAFFHFDVVQLAQKQSWYNLSKLVTQ